MAEKHARSSAEPTDPTTEQARSEIVQMNPRRVTVALELPLPGRGSRPVVTLEWSREDTNMPLSELLQRIEQYCARFGPD